MMKKILTFVPLGVGISATIIYIFNVIQFKVINSSATLLQIVSNLKIYLYIAIAGFIIYFLMKILAFLNSKKYISTKEYSENKIFENTKKDEVSMDDAQNIKEQSTIANTYVPNYDYVPMYHEHKNTPVNNTQNDKKEEYKVNEKQKEEYKVINGNNYCYNCGENIYSTDRYCHNCGADQLRNKKSINPVLKNIINVLEIVILILIIYFSLNMLFDYKESKDPNFKSPFKVGMTKK